MSEPGVSGGCVADPVARAKGGRKRLDTFTAPPRVQPAGRINRCKIWPKEGLVSIAVDMLQLKLPSISLLRPRARLVAQTGAAADARIVIGGDLKTNLQLHVGRRAVYARLFDAGRLII